MTKKSLVALASVINSIDDDNFRARIAVEIGEVCEDANARFNWKMWFKACNTKDPNSSENSI